MIKIILCISFISFLANCTLFLKQEIRKDFPFDSEEKSDIWKKIGSTVIDCKSFQSHPIDSNQRFESIKMGSKCNRYLSDEIKEIVDRKKARQKDSFVNELDIKVITFHDKGNEFLRIIKLLLFQGLLPVKSEMEISIEFSITSRELKSNKFIFNVKEKIEILTLTRFFSNDDLEEEKMRKFIEQKFNDFENAYFGFINNREKDNETGKNKSRTQALGIERGQ